MTKPSAEELAELRTFALELAEVSSAAILPHFRTATNIDNKEAEDFDPVTIADKEAERVMRDLIEQRYPDHGIFGEEFGKKKGSSPYTWILDPIDGTRSFIFGSVTWATLIGLSYDSTPVVGAMNQPYVGECFYGSKDGAFCRHQGKDHKLKVRPAASLSEAHVTTTAPALYNTPRKAAFLDRMRSTARQIRYDGDAYFFSLLAAGHIDVALDAGLQAYDIAALIPIIEAAGGIVTTWDRKSAANGGDIIAAASRDLYEEALALLDS